MNLAANYVCKQMTDVKLYLLYSNTWGHLAVCRQMFGCETIYVCQKKKKKKKKERKKEENELRIVLKYYLHNVFNNHIYLICMYKQNLALNNLQWLICHKPQIKRNQTPSLIFLFFIFFLVVTDCELGSAWVCVLILRIFLKSLDRNLMSLKLGAHLLMTYSQNETLKTRFGYGGQ